MLTRSVLRCSYYVYIGTGRVSALRSLCLKLLLAVRTYKVLAIESSCDDSCVALLEQPSDGSGIQVIDYAKLTLNSVNTGGIVPTDAHSHHQATLANLVGSFMAKNGVATPDLICCTRGPGMVGSLSAGLQLAKGIAVAWNKPLIGVHHMLGHILVATLPEKSETDSGALALESPALTSSTPSYPFLSLLCSGGHTMLVLLKSVSNHRILVDTMDIAAGDSLDKCSRELGMTGVMLAKELEQYINTIPAHKKEEFSKVNTSQAKLNRFNFKLTLPLRRPKHGRDKTALSQDISFAFAGFLSSIQSYKHQNSIETFDQETRQFLAFKTQERVFDHIIDRINLALEKYSDEVTGVKDFIVSGGVAANKRLREKLLNDCNFPASEPVKHHYPSLELCTDNAVMIGVAGIHIFEQLRMRSDLSILPIRKWPLHELLEKDGWMKVGDEEYKTITGK